jgi:hypothetical protein
MAFMKSVFMCDSEVTVARFNAEDNQALCGTNDGRICVFNLNTSSKITDFDVSEVATPITNMKVNLAASSKITTLLCSTAMGKLMELQIVGKNIKRTWEHQE